MHRSAALIPALALSAALGCSEAGSPGDAAPEDTLGATHDTAAEALGNDVDPVESGGTLTAGLLDRGGARVGTVTLTGTPGGVLVRATFDGLPPGTHAFHLHETGACEPDFGAAGGHLNPGSRSHGILDADGPHAGDLPNVHVPESGRLTVEAFAADATLEALTDADGAAVVVHAGPDDYATDPAGAAGDRIACGAIVPSTANGAEGDAAPPAAP